MSILADSVKELARQVASTIETERRAVVATERLRSLRGKLEDQLTQAIIAGDKSAIEAAREAIARAAELLKDTSEKG